MKTFKLVAFYLEDKQGELVQIPIEDALIINKENEKREWLIEIFIKREHLKTFEQYEKDEQVSVEVVITHPDNPPANFVMKLKSLTKMDDYASVLLEGGLNRNRGGFAERLLVKLVDAGLSGEELLKEFKGQLRGKKEFPAKKN